MAGLAAHWVTIITNPGKPNMEIVSRQGEKVVRYQASGQVGSGDGIKAGVAYRMKGGSMVYVPEQPVTAGRRPDDSDEIRSCVMSFRLRVMGMLAATVTVLAAGCASTAPAPDAVSAAFTGKSYVLLGEVHDNAAAQQQRLAALKRAVELGWRPAIAMEQFDRERQADIERARRERPRDADYLIAQAGGGAWQWPLYRPVVALALQYDLPLVAANLSRADAGKIVRGGLDGLFSADERRQLGLDGALPPDLVSAQTAVLDRGHCGNFPKAMLPGMLSAQAARDAVMAQVLRPHAQRGAVLVAGNGHVRRDIGVPRWLAADAGKVLSVGYVESPPGDWEFDMAVVVPAVARKDPCLQAKPAG